MNKIFISLLFTMIFVGSVSAEWDVSTVDSINLYGGGTSIAIDSNDNPAIAYYSGSAVRYAKLNDDSWSTQNIQNANNRFGYTSLKYDSNNRPHVSYSDYLGNVSYAVQNGSIWTTEHIEDIGNANTRTSIAIDSNNYPHICYISGYSTKNVKYIKKVNSVWIKETISTFSSMYSGYIALALDSSDNPNVIYYDYTDSAIKYAVLNGSIWNISIIETLARTSNSNSMRFVSIDIDDNDDVHVVYYDGGSQTLKYAEKSSSTWNIDTVDTVGWMSYNALAIDVNNGIPHLIYTNGDTNMIKIGFKYNESWSISDLKSYGSNADHVSVALDLNNIPHLAYTNDGSNYIEYAKLINTVPSLKWTGEMGYENDALNNEIAFESTVLVYSISYYDEDNYPVKSGYPKLHILNNGLEINGSPYTMYKKTEDDNDYNDGIIYKYLKKLPSGNQYSYFIEAYDIFGSTAIGTPCSSVSGPIVKSLNISSIANVKIVGPSSSRGAINPDKGDPAQIYFNGDDVGDYSCKILSVSGELLFKEVKQYVNNGYFEWVPKDIASGIYIAHVEGPNLNIKKKIAILR